MTLDLAELERLAQEATPQWPEIWPAPNACRCEYHLFIAALSPEVVLWLIQRARLGQAWEALPEALEAVMRNVVVGPWYDEPEQRGPAVARLHDAEAAMW